MGDVSVGEVAKVVVPERGECGRFASKKGDPAKSPEKFQTFADEPRPVLELQPDVAAGKLPGNVLDELAHLKAKASDAATDFGTAIKEQAKKYRINRKALRRVVVAHESGTVEELGLEVDAIDVLLSP